MVTHEYRTKRVHTDNHYKWTIQASVNGRDSWVQVTNMEGKVPLFHHQANALEAALELQNRQSRKPKSPMQFIAEWIEAALDRLEVETEEVRELTINLPTGSTDIASILIGNKEVFVWSIWTCPYAYWTNDYDEIASECGA